MPDGRGCQHEAGLPHRRFREQRPEVLGRRLRAQRQGVPVRRHSLLHRPGADPVRLRELAGRPLLLPRRPAGVHRPRLLRRAPVALRRRRRAVRAGLRDRSRVRPSRPEPARRAGEHPRRPAGPAEQGRAVRATGRLLRRRLGGERRQRWRDRGTDSGRHQRGPRRGERDRRRPHSGADTGPGEPGDVDARLVGATAPLVLARVRERQAGHVRHLLVARSNWVTLAS